MTCNKDFELSVCVVVTKDMGVTYCPNKEISAYSSDEESSDSGDCMQLVLLGSSEIGDSDDIL